MPIPNPTPRAILSDPLRPPEGELVEVLVLCVELTPIFVGVGKACPVAEFEPLISVLATVTGPVEVESVVAGDVTLGKTAPAAVLQ
jgi:hypothetical protein